MIASLGVFAYFFGGVFLCLSVPVDTSPDRGEYVFVKDTQRYVALVRGETQSIGKLDAAGNFLPDPRWFNLKRGQPLPKAPPFTVINAPPQKGVYEYRSGMLIKGDLDEKGNFLPDIGSEVVSFKDYRYREDGPRIYNLPGKFVRKERKNGKK